MRALMMAAGSAVAMVAGSAQAFEVDGYRSGMSISEAQRVAARSGYQLFSPPGENRDGIVWARPSRGSGEMIAGGFPSFQFCDGKMFHYSKSLGAGIGGATAMGDRLSQDYGPGSARFVHQPGDDLRMLRWEWDVGGEQVMVSVSPEYDFVVSARASWLSQRRVCGRGR